MPIHPTAIIDPHAEIDETAEIGPHCVIDGNVRIGARCRLFQNVYVTGWTQLDEGCVLHPGVIVGHEPQDTKYSGVRSYCRIGRGTVIREYATIHRGTTPDSETIVGEECFLLGGCHVAHNCRIGNRVTLINNALLAGHVEIHDRAVVSGGVVVHQFVRIGELAMIAGNARVPLDVVPFALIDEQGRVAGLNRVGLRRAGISREEMDEIRALYRILFHSGLGFQQAVPRLAEEAKTPAGQKILSFVRSESHRGLAGRSRKSIAE
jgi:UDP-N-acetylglucosamine acyltransferase